VEDSSAADVSVVIADEAHRLKEAGAAITLAMKKIRAASCFALSGTVIQNRVGFHHIHWLTQQLDEMWSILDFVRTVHLAADCQVDRGQAGTQREWREFVVNPIKKGHRYEGTVEQVVTAIVRALPDCGLI
jgi:SNF2 family DNA or RNA helicase